MIEIKSTREGYGDALLDLAEQDPNVVVVCADLTKSTYSNKFAEKFPTRFIQVGVAEQNLAGISAGLALSGKTVFMASYASFSPGRNFDFIRTQICYSNANVKIIGSHAGLSSGPDGATHQMLEDIALMRTLPNTTVLSPCDYWEARKATIKSTQIKTPVYIRLYKEPTPAITHKDSVFELGTWSVLKDGLDACIIGHGPVLHQAMLAEEKLRAQNLSVKIINATTIKPLDENMLIELVSKFKVLLVLEEHQKAGGLGSAVSEFLSARQPTKVITMGVDNAFGESGKYLELLAKHSLTEASIIDTVLKLK